MEPGSTEPPAITPDVRVFANTERTAESDRRLDVLNSTIGYYQEQFDFIEGATAYGSTIHGGAGPESDFDTFVYVNPDKLPEEFSTETDGVRTMTKEDRLAIGKAMQADLMSELGQKVVKSDTKRNDVRVVPMNEDIIKDRLGRWFDDMDIYLDKEGHEVAALFHPAVGDKGTIEHLRGVVINELNTLPNGEKVWKNINTWVSQFEGRGKLQEIPGGGLPESLEDATRTFS